MKNTFTCNDSMIITIPIGSLKDAREGQLLPEKFHCVFRDAYKVFAIKGKPKPLGAVQAIAGVFVVTLGLIFTHMEEDIMNLYTLPSTLFVITGFLSYAAGQSPNMHVAKLSFSLNIISFFWSVVNVCLLATMFKHHQPSTDSKVHEGIRYLIVTLLVVETLIALFLIYWLSKAVCRQNFNTLPIILLKQ
ncbi:hypothetical protein PAMA_015069 [Pampus argenteus]